MNGRSIWHNPNVARPKYTTRDAIQFTDSYIGGMWHDVKPSDWIFFAIVNASRVGSGQVGERRTIDELEHERPLRVRNRCNVGMVERSEYLGFTAESGEPIRIGGARLVQYLDCNITFQLRVPCPVDLALCRRPRGPTRSLMDRCGCRERAACATRAAQT